MGYIPNGLIGWSHGAESLQLPQQLHYLHVHLHVFLLQLQLLLAQLAYLLLPLLHFALHHPHLMHFLVTIKRN